MLTGTNASYSTDRGVTITNLYTNQLAGGAIGVQNAGTNLTWNGRITGSGSFIKTGAGILTIANSSSSTPNNYTGGTYIEGGTLALGWPTAIPNGSNITIFSARFRPEPGKRPRDFSRLRYDFR